mgnify:CR=1 FL=1
MQHRDRQLRIGNRRHAEPALRVGHRHACEAGLAADAHHGPGQRGSEVVDDLAAGQYPMPTTCDGDDHTFIGRIREDLSFDHGLAFWCVSDNLRKGAATNAVQIAELLVERAAKA